MPSEEYRAKVIALLKFARRRIVKGWTRGCDARDEGGNDVDPLDARAVKWCALGATATFGGRAVRKSATKLLNAACGVSIVQYNDSDGRKKGQILAIYDEAIKLAEAS